MPITDTRFLHKRSSRSHWNYPTSRKNTTLQTQITPLTRKAFQPFSNLDQSGRHGPLQGDKRIRNGVPYLAKSIAAPEPRVHGGSEGLGRKLIGDLLSIIECILQEMKPLPDIGINQLLVFRVIEQVLNSDQRGVEVLERSGQFSTAKELEDRGCSGSNPVEQNLKHSPNNNSFHGRDLKEDLRK
ncbi:hypothetical protein AKJ16_DCAP22150 [Drosera capensis]